MHESRSYTARKMLTVLRIVEVKTQTSTHPEKYWQVYMTADVCCKGFQLSAAINQIQEIKGKLDSSQVL